MVDVTLVMEFNCLVRMRKHIQDGMVMSMAEKKLIDFHTHLEIFTFMALAIDVFWHPALLLLTWKA